jgi:hypothetical protein
MAHFLEERTLDLEKEHALIGMTLLAAESLVWVPCQASGTHFSFAGAVVAGRESTLLEP